MDNNRFEARITGNLRKKTAETGNAGFPPKTLDVPGRFPWAFSVSIEIKSAV